MQPSQAIVLPQGIEPFYEDLFGPLMPFCVKLTGEKIVFKLPANLLSGQPSQKFKDYFKAVDVENEITIEPETHDSWMQRTVPTGVKMVTLWFKKPLTH